MTNEKLAMKVFSPETQEDYPDLFEHEVTMMTACRNCDKIVRFKESFIADGEHCLVMQYMPAGDLFQQLESRNCEPFGENEARHLLHQICLAVKQLHDCKILHRDLKLENVVLIERESGCQAKLADLGLAEFVSSEKATSKIKVSGTPGYIAPEVTKRESYGTASDIWSLGCILFTMLTARMYFAPQDPFKVDEFGLGHLSPACKELLTALLSVKPEGRPKIEEVLQHPFF